MNLTVLRKAAARRRRRKARRRANAKEREKRLRVALARAENEIVRLNNRLALASAQLEDCDFSWVRSAGVDAADMALASAPLVSARDTP